MMKRPAAILFVLTCSLAVGATDDVPAIDAAPEPVHSVGLDKLAVEIRRLFLNENPAALRIALKQLEGSCRELKPEESDPFSSEGVTFDQGLHRALDRTRELVANGDLEHGEQQYNWVLRACTSCHQTTRKLGLGPAAPLP